MYFFVTDKVNYIFWFGKNHSRSKPQKQLLNSRNLIKLNISFSIKVIRKQLIVLQKSLLCCKLFQKYTIHLFMSCPSIWEMNHLWMNEFLALKNVFFNAIQDGLFWGFSQMGGGEGAKGPPLPSLISLIHILQWWNLAQLYLT